LDIYGSRELGLSEAKGKFTFALKRDKGNNVFQTRRVYEVQNIVSRILEANLYFVIYQSKNILSVKASVL